MTQRIIEEDVKAIGDGLKDVAGKLSGKTVLVTGGAGFLGNYFLLTISYLNKNALEKPCRVISADNFVTGVSYRVKESETFKAIKHDVTKPLEIEEKIDFIIHLAGIASPRFYRKFKIETIDVATLGTKNMLELAKEKKVESMLFSSSSEVYGDPDPRFVPSDETYNGNVSPIGPRSNYDEGKRLGETMCVAYYETHKVPVKMVRPFNVFGPGMRLDDYRVIPNFVAHAFNGTPLPVYGDGHSTRTFCYVTDAMEGFFRVLLSGQDGEPYNVGNDNDEITIYQLASKMADVFKGKVKAEHTTGPNDAYAKGDPKRRCPNISKIRKLGYEPKVKVDEGLKRFILWAADEHKNTSEAAEAVKQS